ncbi:MAG: ATP-binding protein [Proteobacteria bacterium]|nr:ATP-binding protein [Pseudomonadota bacterium]
MKLLHRLLKLPKNNHFFLFGPRNTGKSTLLEHNFPAESSLIIDLLDSAEEDRFARNPNELVQIVAALPETTTHVIIDEIQKIPRLLDIVQQLMRKTHCYFIMSGSSARKLKKGGANLLAGRAFVYHLFPFTSLELGIQFNLDTALQWGTLPQILNCNDNHDRQEFLHAYAHTYLKEEIWNEHVIRQLDPFRRFLEVAAQCNGKIINFSNIARDVGVTDKTISSYFSILEDTLIGFFLESFHNSFRKRFSNRPKFYFFDTGVVRALTRTTSIPLVPRTNDYGNAFEHFIILECRRLAEYHRREYRFSYLRTVNDAEIDLIVERPGKPLLCIEIKSSTQINREEIRPFITLSADIPNSEAVVFCNEKYAKKIDNVLILPWQKGLEQYF